MSTIGGKGSNGNYTVSTEGLLRFADGREANLTTAEGMAKARGMLDDVSLEELKGLMRAQGYRFDGTHFAPDDSYKRAGRSTAGGPTATDSGKDDLDESLAALFSKAGVTSPYNANTTPALEKKLKGSPGFAGAVDSLKSYLENPTEQNQKAAATAASKLADEYAGNSVMEILYLVFRESIKEVNEDKKYFLKKLMDFNKMGEQLSQYLSTLIDASNRLSEQSRGKEEPQKETISIDVREFDTKTLDANGNMIATKNESRVVDRYALTDRIKYVETQQEDVRNRRQMSTTAFQNFDQKSNQLMNMMSTILKTVNEMRSIGAASRSGL